MPRRIDRIPNAHKLEVWRKEAPQIFLVLEFVFVKSIALLAGRILRESVSTEYPVRPEALNDRSHDGIDFFFGKMFDGCVPNDVVKRPPRKSGANVLLNEGYIWRGIIPPRMGDRIFIEIQRDDRLSPG